MNPRQGGSTGDDDMEAIALGPDGTVVLAGYSDTSWETDNLGINDLLAVALNTTAFTPATTTAPPAPAPAKGGALVLSSEPLLAGISVAVAAALVAGGVWVHRRQKKSRVLPGSLTPPIERHEHGAGLGTFRALGEAAGVMAHNCQVPGVSEAAALMEVVVKLMSDGRDSIAECESRLRQCRSIIVMLRRVEDLREVCMDVDEPLRDGYRNILLWVGVVSVSTPDESSTLN